MSADATTPPETNVDGTPFGPCAWDGCPREGYYRAGLCPEHFDRTMDEGEAAYSGLFPTASDYARRHNCLVGGTQFDPATGELSNIRVEDCPGHPTA